MKQSLIFKHYDQAINFKILNDLPKKTQISMLTSNKVALLNNGKVIKINTNDKKGKEWIVI